VPHHIAKPVWWNVNCWLEYVLYVVDVVVGL
jgi:hypothetical protein